MENKRRSSPSRRNSSNLTVCRHGDDCYTANCPYKHSSSWKVCESGKNCENFDCSATHPPGRLKPCRYNSACHKQDCPYLHPDVHRVKHTSTTRVDNKANRNTNKMHSSSRSNSQMKVQTSSQVKRHHLPISGTTLEFCDRLLDEKVLFVAGATGSGKSTQLPQYAAHCFPDGLVVSTQPHALAVMSAAHFVAAQYEGLSVGNSVGYQISSGQDRGENYRFVGTKIMFMTDDALVQEFQIDSDLSEICVLIIDQVHQRSLNTDMIMGIAKILLRKRQNDFRVVIVTNDTDLSVFMNFFECPSSQPLFIANHHHRIPIEYIPPPIDCSDHKFLETHLIPILLQFYPKHCKHTLVFLSNTNDIDKALRLFRQHSPRGCVALPLYEKLPIDQLNQIYQNDDQQPNVRMVLFCTNIAESALPIDNVDLIIDSGLERELCLDISNDFLVLETKHVSRFSADTRQQTASRSESGRCIRLYDKDALIIDKIKPEIVRSSLDLVVLQVQRAHLNFDTFPWITRPNPISIQRSIDLLSKLQCLNRTLTLTSQGKLFVELSLNPCLSAFMLNVYLEQPKNRWLCLRVFTIVAILSQPGSILAIGDKDEDRSENLHRDMTFSDQQCSSDLFDLSELFFQWLSVGIVDNRTNQCKTCHKSVDTDNHTCRSCRQMHSFLNGLNNDILELIENEIYFYGKKVTRSSWIFSTDLLLMKRKITDQEIIGRHLRQIFPSQVGHLLVPHLPDEGARLIQGNLRTTISNKSIFVQHVYDPNHQYFVTMSITRLRSGHYMISRLHQLSEHDLPTSPIQRLLDHDHIALSTYKELRTTLRSAHSESWAQWLVHDYDQHNARLIIWGLAGDLSTVERILNPILTNIDHQTIDCGPIKAKFQDGLICSSIEIRKIDLRLNLQCVPCRTFEKLLIWLKSKLHINYSDIKENNFQEMKSKSNQNDDDPDDAYEAPPFYIVLKSSNSFERATTLLTAPYLCPQEDRSLSTTGAHMSEKDAWGRQLLLTIPQESPYIVTREIMERFVPLAVDCRRISKGNLRAQPGIQIINLPHDANESFVQQLVLPIKPIGMSLRKTNRDTIGSASAHVFFAHQHECQQVISVLQSDFCTKSLQITVRDRHSHNLVLKNVFPAVEKLPDQSPNPQIFLITSTNRGSATQIYRDIVPKLEPTWKVDSTATVTVLHPHLYPDFDNFVQQIATRFETNVKQQALDVNPSTGTVSIRYFFSHGTPKQTAAAAAMLAEATSPVIIKINDERQHDLFDELLSTGTLERWSFDLKLEVMKKEKRHVWLEIWGPQIQQGQLMRQIGDYSDQFDQRYRVIELNSAMAHFFGRKTAADNQLVTVGQTWLNWSCHVKYSWKMRSIIIHGEQSTKPSLIDGCEEEVKQILKSLSSKSNLASVKRQCSFCGRVSNSMNRFRLCEHYHCRCAASYLIETYPMYCPDSACRKNIDMRDIFEIFENRQDLIAVCKKSIEIYLKKNPSMYDVAYCPDIGCNGLLTRSRGYQLCLSCGKSVCPLCSLIDDDSHNHRSCAERNLFKKMGDFLPELFKAAEKFARDNWTPSIPPIIRIDYNLALAQPCPSMQRFYRGIQALGHPSPPDMARGFFAFHGTPALSIKPICFDGFDPSRRRGQACGPGEYFGVTAPISHGYCRPVNPQGPFSMIIAFLVHCPQLSTRPGFCHVMNNPIDWSHAFNIPVIVVTYGTQTSCQSPLDS